MQHTVKQELHELVDKCNDELLLKEAKDLLSSEVPHDWWDELSDNDKSLLLQSEKEFEAGDYIPHQQLMQQFEQGRKK